MTVETIEIAANETAMLFSVYVPFASALLGGLLSLAGSALATWRSNAYDKKVRNEALERSQAESAFSAFSRLMDAHNTAANLLLHINEMFRSAEESGGQELEPWAKVMEIVGAEDEIEKIDPSEIVFLIEEKKAELINDIPLIIRRVRNNAVSTQRYNDLRSETMKFMKDHADETNLGEGTRVGSVFSGKAAKQAQMYEYQLNNLLGQIIENLEKDVVKSWDIVSAFNDAASERFGNLYPKFKVEQRSNRSVEQT